MSITHTGFHAKEGWWFRRDDDGAVAISTPTETVTVDANTWASIVASVSAAGETFAFQAARRLHEGDIFAGWPS
jgi:hypothetical protein